MESVCICGPSPMRIAGWKINPPTPMGVSSMRHEETGEVLSGRGVQYWMNYAWKCGNPLESLDRRAGVWTAYSYGFEKLYSYPDPRPYPYPESARR